MNVPFSVYRLSDGMISHSGSCVEGDLNEQNWPDWALAEQEVYPEALNDAEWYLPGGVPTERPALSVSDVTIPADNEDHIIVTGLPEGTKVFVDQQPQGEAIDGLIEVFAHEPGSFQIHLEPPFPWREATITVTVT